jgi:hypothetical protein
MGAFIAEAERVCFDARSRGVKIDGTRMAKYVRLLRQVEAANYAPIPNRPDDLAEFVEATSQLALLILSRAIWDGVDQRELCNRLSTVCEGPELPPSGDDMPRNILLELVACALLQKLGGQIELPKNDADAFWHKPPLPRLAVEAKRPEHLRRLRKNLQKLRGQFEQREVTSGTRGVAVLGLDRVVGQAGEIERVPSVAHANDIVYARIKRLAAEVRELLTKPHSRLFPVAPVVLLVLTRPLYVLDPGCMYVVTDSMIMHSGPREDPLTRQIFDVLRPLVEHLEIGGWYRGMWTGKAHGFQVLLESASVY